MRLKRLEIQGFKSFNDKTVLQFDDSITGIVGPNGCGKSNIVDAIRWVMGEQSAKHLRGSHMEDVIFSGSVVRQAANMASVELTFSTEGAQTPINYADCPEISIGRHLYRTGESEYLINKQPVRLKDVVDLFLGTGVGTKAYSIIEQGRVGQIVTAKSEERRSFIEEAAGISKFKVRKEAALRKMEATQQNLLRLKDILAEIERQMSSLDRQAKKAQKYKVVRDELMSLELLVAARDFGEGMANQSDLLAGLKEADEREQTLRNKVDEVEAWIEAERLELASTEQEVTSLQQDNFEWENRLRLAEARLSAKRDEMTRQERDAESLGRALYELEQERDGLANGLSQVNANKSTADLECEGLEESVFIKEVEYNRLQEASRDLFSIIESARDAAGSAAGRLTQLDAQILNLRERFEETSIKKLDGEAELASLTQQHQELFKQHKDINEQLGDVRQLKLSLGEQTGQLEADLKEEEIHNRIDQEALEGLKEELLKRKSRLHSLEELERNFEGYQEGPRHVLKWRRNGDIGFDLASVADILETKPEFETAVSALLGERMQFLVVPGADQGVQCAELLKSSGVGRGSFIPLSAWADEDTTVVIDYHTPDDVPGYRGRLADFVSVKPGFEKLKKSLFGDVLLVDAVGHALEAWQHTRRGIVTLEGEVIAPDGTLTGGNLENASKALLEKKREMKELGVQVEALVAQVSAKAETCVDSKHRIQSLKAGLDELKNTVHGENLRLATQEKDVVHLGQRLESLNQRRGQIAQQIFEWTEALDRQSLQLETLVAHQSTHRTSLAEATKVLNEKRATEDACRTDLSTRQEELTREKIHLAQARQQRTYLEKEIGRMSEERLLVASDIVRKEEALRLSVKQRFHAEDIADFLGKAISGILLAKTAADGLYREKKDIFDFSLNTLREREGGLKQLRSEHDRVKNALNADTLALTEIRGNLQRLSEQVFERYQLLLAEVYQEHLVVPEGFDFDVEAEKAREMRLRLASMGSVNLAAIEEFEEHKTRFEFLDAQRQDLENSLKALEDAIQKINRTTKERFEETFRLVNEKFSYLFPKLFRGGQAYLQMTDPENTLETGIEIVAQPPGKKLQSIMLLSGGEKALTAVSLLFAIFLIKPSPFCLLDEVDAPLDDVNVDRYNEIIKEMAQRTQFVVITHNKRTMQMTDCLFGVTMQDPGVSQLVSVDLS